MLVCHEVEIDPVVLYLLLVVFMFAFIPPVVCKIKHMLCENRVSDYLEEAE